MIASRQAASRKAEGIEPRKRLVEKDDAVVEAEVKTDTTDKWRGGVRFSGVGDRGMPDIVIMREPGRPCASSY